MKNYLFLIALSLLFGACGAEADDSQSVTSAPAVSAANVRQLTTIEWIDSAKNLGKINEGQQLQISFRFKNSGDKPLIIQSVQPGCGCTVADYPKEPIAPGAEASITGSFDSNGREGLQHKEILVTANTAGNNMHKIAFTVEVMKARVPN